MTIYEFCDLTIAVVSLGIAASIFYYMWKRGIPFTFDDTEDEEEENDK